jgi:hypothetical protein
MAKAFLVVKAFIPKMLAGLGQSDIEAFRKTLEQIARNLEGMAVPQTGKSAAVIRSKKG